MWAGAGRQGLSYATAPGVLILLPSKPFYTTGRATSACGIRVTISRHDLFGGSEEATLIAVPYWFYKLGAQADRGTVLIVLDERAPDSSRDGSQAERPSSAKEERP